MKRVRLYVTILVVSGVIGAILFVPLPSHVYCPLEVQARNAATVYVTREGILDSVPVRPGDQVKEGDLLAQLHNIDIDIAIAELTGQRDVYSIQLEGLQRVSFADRHAARRSIRFAKLLASTKKQLASREERSRLLRTSRPTGRHRAAAAARGKTWRRRRPPAHMVRLAVRSGKYRRSPNGRTPNSAKSAIPTRSKPDS